MSGNTQEHELDLELATRGREGEQGPAASHGALIPSSPDPPVRDGYSKSWLTMTGFLFLTFNSGMAVYRSDRDLGSIVFVGICYVDLVLLFFCLRTYEGTQVDSPRRNFVKMMVWFLTSSLTVMFSYKVATVWPLPIAAVVWFMAVSGLAGVFFAFFAPARSRRVLA